MTQERCMGCNKLMATVSPRNRCSGCGAWYCPSCRDRFCRYCKAPVLEEGAPA